MINDLQAALLEGAESMKGLVPDAAGICVELHPEQVCGTCGECCLCDWHLIMCDGVS